MEYFGGDSELELDPAWNAPDMDEEPAYRCDECNSEDLGFGLAEWESFDGRHSQEMYCCHACGHVGYFEEIAQSVTIVDMAEWQRQQMEVQPIAALRQQGELFPPDAYRLQLEVA